MYSSYFLKFSSYFSKPAERNIQQLQTIYHQPIWIWCHPLPLCVRSSQCTFTHSKHLHEICSSVWAGRFVNIRWLESPGLGIIADITAISGTVLIELFTLTGDWEGGGRGMGTDWLCGGLMPSIFLCQRGFCSVSNPARAPAAPTPASPKAQDTSSQTHHHPHTPPPHSHSSARPALYWVPPWPGCGRWNQVHTAGMIAVTAVFFCSSAGTPALSCLFGRAAAKLQCRQTQADWWNEWLTGQIAIEAWGTRCSVQYVHLHYYTVLRGCVHCPPNIH